MLRGWLRLPAALRSLPRRVIMFSWWPWLLLVLSLPSPGLRGPSGPPPFLRSECAGLFEIRLDAIVLLALLSGEELLINEAWSDDASVALPTPRFG